jgi:hypothetical protein
VETAKLGYLPGDRQTDGQTERKGKREGGKEGARRVFLQLLFTLHHAAVFLFSPRDARDLIPGLSFPFQGFPKAMTN